MPCLLRVSTINSSAVGNAHRGGQALAVAPFAESYPPRPASPVALCLAAGQDKGTSWERGVVYATSRSVQASSRWAISLSPRSAQTNAGGVVDADKSFEHQGDGNLVSLT